MKSFFLWLFSPSRALQQAQAEITYLREENRRLNDLFTQALESSRIIPIQAAHHQPVRNDPIPARTIGAMQAEFAERRLREREAWEREEAARQEELRRVKESAN